MTTERPILFSGEMIRAILDGRKTQTRRVVKPQPEYGVCSCHYSKTGWGESTEPDGNGNIGCTCRPVRFPYGFGNPGDRLWVREKWANVEGMGLETADNNPASVVYAADEPWEDEAKDLGIAWKPSIFMPRSASRITLEITIVRVERLQDISIADAVSEGIPCAALGIKNDVLCIAQYADIWESINGGGSWDMNPWVWVIEFKRV